MSEIPDVEDLRHELIGSDGQTNTLQRYAEYKDTGAEWIGEVPSHWTVKPLFAVGRERQVKNKGFVEDNLLSLSYGRIIRKDIEDNFGLLPASFETYQIVEPGNIILRLTDLQNDKRSLRTGLVRERGIITSAYVCLQFKGIDSTFAYRLLHSYDVSKVFYFLGAGVRQTMKFADLKYMPMLIPPDDEQKSIIAFLDRETAKIDVLIAKKEQLIALLQEQRSAIISHAVTKGLDPDAPMKDSGVEWLGEIPAHWEVKRLKFLLQAIDSGFSPQCDDRPAEEEQWGVLKTGCVNYGRFDESQNKTLPEDIEVPLDYEVHQGDVLMSRASGSVELIGSVAFVATQPKARLLLSDKIFRLVLKETFADAGFVTMVMGAREVREQIRLAVSGAEGLANNIAKSSVRELMITTPPLHEQQDICEYVEYEVGKLDSLAAIITSTIATLQEYRTALISAAVTGKIDVRGEV